jgi:Uma2 family endonuclease
MLLRFSVAEYHRLTEIGILTEDDNLELIKGYLVHKMARNPLHDGTMHQVFDVLNSNLPAGWDVRIGCAVTLADSVPEPDLAVVREDAAGYMTRHPGPADVGLVVEVSDSTLAGDRADKGRIYARAGIPYYWIINLPDGQVEVYEGPSGPAAVPAYARRQDHRPGDTLPFILDGALIAALTVQGLMG